MALSIHLNYRFATLSHANPLDRHVEILLNEVHVVLGGFRQVTEISHVGCRLLPAWKRDVFNFHLSQIRDGAWEVVDDFAVELVAEIIKKIKLLKFTLI